MRGIIALLLLLVASSCATHSTFPFICFRSGCVHQQWNMRGMQKNMKAKLFAMKHKRGKPSKVPDEKRSLTAKVTKAFPDDSGSSSGTLPFYTKVKLVFHTSDAAGHVLIDSMMTGMQDGRKISGSFDAETSACIENFQLRRDRIDHVSVRIWDNDSSHAYAGKHRRRVKYLKKYLATKGIARSAIRIEDSKP